MPRTPQICAIMLLGIAAAATTGCDSKKRNASEEVFQSGGQEMNDRLDAYAEEPEADEAVPPDPGETPVEETDPTPPADPMDS